MKKLKHSIVGSIALLLITYYTAVAAQQIPADTYFSLAVSDNSHNHYGENLLFLDFGQQDSACNTHPHAICVRPLQNNSIKLDGYMDDWQQQTMTYITGRVMNNYPLDLHYDATPTEIRLAATFDDKHIYFLISWEDANHDASINRNRWVFNQGKWQSQAHVTANSGTPAGTAINSKEKLSGVEDEDQLFMMFPIVDQQKNFRSGGLGCAGYCHANLYLSGNPKDAKIGDGVSSMHTAILDDKADLWHWTATRTAPMNTLKDGYIDYGDQSYNGRKTDAGSHSFDNNGQKKGQGNSLQPEFVHREDYETGKYNLPGYRTARLTRENSIKITSDMTFADNVSIPFYVHKPATGSLADVETSAFFNENEHTWTVEIKRKLQTNDANDHQFIAGKDAIAPTHSLVARGDPIRGKQLFEEKACADCHGDSGQGTFSVNKSVPDEGFWSYPRNQRTSAPAIRKTVSIHRPERLIALGAELEKYEEEPPRVLMPFIHLTPQEVEDIASWLQQQYIQSME